MLKYVNHNREGLERNRVPGIVISVDVTRITVYSISEITYPTLIETPWIIRPMVSEDDLKTGFLDIPLFKRTKIQSFQHHKRIPSLFYDYVHGYLKKSII